ncbi:MAG TPA: hypothetical protein VN493_24185 [Thermoanaerobaculia bacterium]|nr:hypothetical protein [Thermoanaerobaculia bacterium]
MGWTTGPWERKTQGSEEVLHGHFLTVWKKQADGKWRWVIDTGIEHPKPAVPEGDPPPVPAEKMKGPVPKVDVAAETKALLAADRELGMATGKGTPAAYLARITDDARLMRDGAFPNIGREAIRAALEKPGKAPAAMTSEPMGGDVSASGDLGYTYGNAQWKSGDQAVKVGHPARAERPAQSNSSRVRPHPDPAGGAVRIRSPDVEAVSIHCG